MGGTTHEMMTPSIRGSIEGAPKGPRRSPPYSSAVRSASVWMRQWRTSFSPPYTPSTVFVFPTSIASSIRVSRRFSLVSYRNEREAVNAAKFRRKSIIRRGKTAAMEENPRSCGRAAAHSPWHLDCSLRLLIALSRQKGDRDATDFGDAERFHDSRDAGGGGSVGRPVGRRHAQPLLGARRRATAVG